MKPLLMGDEGTIEGDFDAIEVARSPTQWAAINLRPSHSHIRAINANVIPISWSVERSGSFIAPP